MSTANRGLGVPPKAPYTQPSLDVHEQVQLLIEKGLTISDIPSAEHWLSHNSYFRLKNYSYSFKDYQNKNGNYTNDTTFENIRDLYLFDRKLKMLLFEAIENIEISVKTQLSNSFSKSHGSHWYTNSDHFITKDERRQIIRNTKYKEDIPKSFDHEFFIAEIEKHMNASEEIFLQLYKSTYTPIHPPSWMMMEIITFGTLSLMFENLKPSTAKTSVCDCYKVTKKQLVSWLHCFSFIRNKCAHHARIVYSKINFAPSMPMKKSRQFLNEAEDINNDRLYAILCCIQYMLSCCNTNSLFKTGILKITEEFPHIDYPRLGFTTHWKDEPL